MVGEVYLLELEVYLEEEGVAVDLVKVEEVYLKAVVVGVAN